MSFGFGMSGRILPVALISLGVAGAVAWSYTREPVMPIPASVPVEVKPEIVVVLTALRTLDVGVMPEATDFAVMELALSQVDGDFLRDNAENRAALASLPVSRVIPKGTVFVKSDLVSRVTAAPNPSAPAPVLKLPSSSDLRAIEVALTGTTSVMGPIATGDRVDIMVSYQAPNGVRALRNVFKNLRVIEAGQAPLVPEDRNPFMTLELPSDSVPVLALARLAGDLIILPSPLSTVDIPSVAYDDPMFTTAILGARSNNDDGTARVQIVRGAGQQGTSLSTRITDRSAEQLAADAAARAAIENRATLN